MFVLLRTGHKDTSYYKDIWVKKQALFMSFIVLQVEGDWCQIGVRVMWIALQAPKARWYYRKSDYLDCFAGRSQGQRVTWIVLEW